MVDGEGTDVVEIQKDSSGKYPETVSWSQYVAVKESLGRKLDSERNKAKSLEEQLKTTVKPEDYSKLKTELEETTKKFATVNTELTGIKDKSLSEKRSVLVKAGTMTEEETKQMSEKELDVALKVLGKKVSQTPGADLGGGGGSGATLAGLSILELATRGYSKQ